MGNAIAKKYDAPKDYTSTAGHLNLWKIWPGKSKENGQEVSIWVFDKNELSKRKVNPINDKSIQEQIFQIMKKDLNNIKDITTSSNGNCNGIVQFKEIIEESSSVIVFVTEKIVCSLSDLLNNFEGIPNSPTMESMINLYLPVDQTNRSVCLSELEISRGLYNTIEGLAYFHSVYKKLHCNISPENIVINTLGQWKLLGFGFCLSFQSSDNKSKSLNSQGVPSPYFLRVSNSLIRLEPDLRYMAPELTVGGDNPNDIRYISTDCDVFSLGLIAYQVFSYYLDPSNRTSYRKSQSIIQLSTSSPSMHQLAIANHLNAYLSTHIPTYLPATLHQLLISMLAIYVSNRISIANLLSHIYFTSGTFTILNQLDNLRYKDIQTQSSTLLLLADNLKNLPKKIYELSILPIVSSLVSNNPSLLPYTFDIHRLILKEIGRDQYVSSATSSISKALVSSVLSPDVIVLIVKEIRFIVDSFPQTIMEEPLVGFISNALDINNTNIQVQTLRVLCNSVIINYISSKNILTKLIPRICKESCKNSDLSIKIHCLYLLSLLSPSRLDKNYILCNIIPTFKYILEKERNSSIVCAVLLNYQAISDKIGCESIATSILPLVIPLLVDKSLDKQQYQLVQQTVKSLVDKCCQQRCIDQSLDFNNIDSTNLLDPFLSIKILLDDKTSDSKSDSFITSNNPTSYVASDKPNNTTNIVNNNTNNYSYNNQYNNAANYTTNNPTNQSTYFNNVNSSPFYSSNNISINLSTYPSNRSIDESEEIQRQTLTKVKKQSNYNPDRQSDATNSLVNNYFPPQLTAQPIVPSYTNQPAPVNINYNANSQKNNDPFDFLN